MEKHHYNISLEWKEGRIGEMEADGLEDRITVATPPEFDKGVSGIWSPEHLFTASILSCFMTTFLAIAEYSKLEYKDFSCTANGVLEKIDGKFLMSEVNLKAKISIKNEDKKGRATRVLEKSEAACLISNSVKTDVHLETDVRVVA